MRKLYFLVPGTSGQYACGGLWAELKTLKLAQHICPSILVTYRQKERDTLFLDDLLHQLRSKTEDPASVIFVISWGFDVPKLAKKLNNYLLIYHAHSSGYGFRLPSHIPILTVSRNSLGYWGQRCPQSLLYWLPNQISDDFYNYHQPREIDVLVQTRKSSSYLLHHLIPALQSRCTLTVVDSYVPDLPGLFNQAKVYLYDSAEYWAIQGVSEGFGLQPMEAMACGCQVFSSVNGGLADYLDPGFNSYKIAGYSLAFDVDRILCATLTNQLSPLPDWFLMDFRTDSILQRLKSILTEINTFFDRLQPVRGTNDSGLTPIPQLTPMGIHQLRWRHRWIKLAGRVKKKLGYQSPSV
ncbi:MAG: glycosyltransferase [Synechococcales cyanobacterium]